MAYCRMTACPADRMKRSRSGHMGSLGSYFMTRVHSTWASGARAIAVPGWPELARWGPSMAKPRMTLIASCSSSASLGTVAPLRCLSRVRTLCLPVREKDYGRGEAVQEVLPTHWAHFPSAEHPGDGGARNYLGDGLGIVVWPAEQARTPSVA